jgi:hypothetical protein
MEQMAALIARWDALPHQQQRLMRAFYWHLILTLTILPLLLLTSPALAGPVRCTTYQEKTLGRLQTLCDDGTRAVSTYNTTLSRWESTVTPPPGKACTGAAESPDPPGGGALSVKQRGEERVL